MSTTNAAAEAAQAKATVMPKRERDANGNLIITGELALQILNSRARLTRNHIGQRMLGQIQGQGQFVSAEDSAIASPVQKAYFDKYIYNLRATTDELISRKSNRIILAMAQKAEKDGDKALASSLYNQWLNGTQVSFNVIADGPRVRKFESGDAVTFTVDQAQTREGGMAIVVNDVRYKAPEVATKSTFSLTDLLETSDISEEDMAAVANRLAERGVLK